MNDWHSANLKAAFAANAKILTLLHIFQICLATC